MADMGWKMRLAIVLSILWIVFAIVLSLDEQENSLGSFILMGILPISFIWGIAWVIQGFRKNHNKSKNESQERKGNSVVSELQNSNVVISDINFDYKSMVVLGIVCIGIVAYGYMYSESTTGNVAFLAGENIVFALLIWGVFHVALGRKQNKATASLSYFIIFCSLMVSSFVGYSLHKNNINEFVSGFEKDYSSFVNSSTDTQGKPQRIEKYFDPAPTKKGELGEMERFIKTYLNQLSSLQNNYLSDLDAIGWGKILDSERLQKDSKLIESKVMIGKAKDIIVKYRDRTYTLIESKKKDIHSLDMGESSKREFLRGFETGSAKTRSQIDTMWKLEGQIISEFENIITLLSSKKGDWMIDNGQILFNSSESLSSFNSYLAAIQDLSSKQDALRRQGVEATNSTLNKLKN